MAHEDECNDEEYVYCGKGCEYQMVVHLSPLFNLVVIPAKAGI